MRVYDTPLQRLGVNCCVDDTIVVSLERVFSTKKHGTSVMIAIQCSWINFSEPASTGIASFPLKSMFRLLCCRHRALVCYQLVSDNTNRL